MGSAGILMAGWSNLRESMPHVLLVSVRSLSIKQWTLRVWTNLQVKIQRMHSARDMEAMFTTVAQPFKEDHMGSEAMGELEDFAPHRDLRVW